MMEFKDYLGKLIKLTEESLEHIKESHPEIELNQIQHALLDPDEVRKSSF